MKKIQIFDALRDLIPFVHTKTIIPPWVFFTFLKLYKWYQIAQRTTYWSYVAKLDVNPFLANIPILHPLKTPENFCLRHCREMS